MNNYTPRRYLITGGAGFIGSNFIRYLLSNHADIQITNLDLLTYAGSLDYLENLQNANQHHFIKGDICDADLVNKILRENSIDTIVHFAAESHVDRSIATPAQFIKTNILGTYTLLDAARDYWLNEKHLSREQCRFHHISTDEVYGTLQPDSPAFTEDTPYAPNSPYSASKAGSDHIVRAYFHTYGLPITTSNCSNNYGPYQHDEKFIPTIIKACLQKRPIPVYGDGSNIRDWLYVVDHCRGIDTIIRQAKVGEVYNVGGNEEHSNIDIARTICQLMDELFSQNATHEKLITFVKDRPGHDWRYAINCQKLQEELGWKPLETLTKGLEKTIEFYLS